MNSFDNTINTLLAEDFKSAAAAGMIGLGALVGPSAAQAASPAPSISRVDNSFIGKAFEYIKDNEGLKLKPYRDSKGILTIGVGHRIMPDEDFSSGIDKEQAQEIFSKDVLAKINVAERLFPKYNTYPDYVKIALLDGVFRGDHKAKYKTTKFINNGDFKAAARESIRNNDYTTSKANNTGVWKRMLANSSAMLKFGTELR
jgi:GH24 family phage-related lysozyme (muramidase)